MAEAVIYKQIKKMVEKYVAKYSENTGVKDYWRLPLTVSAKTDKRFNILPEIAADDHVLPGDLLKTCKSVIVFFVPFIEELARENHKGKIPCRNWGIAYEATNALINSLCKEIKAFLSNAGYKSVLIPSTHNFDEKMLMSRWSHKHLGYIAGLGRFGVNAQFITPSGCAGRLGSLVTEADLGNNPLVSEKEFCLYKNGHNCLECVKRCPVGAVSAEKGINRQKCWARLNLNNSTSEELKGLEKTTQVCGKCQVLLPCSLKAPAGFA